MMMMMITEQCKFSRNNSSRQLFLFVAAALIQPEELAEGDNHDLQCPLDARRCSSRCAGRRPRQTSQFNDLAWPSFGGHHTDPTRGTRKAKSDLFTVALLSFEGDFGAPKRGASSDAAGDLPTRRGAPRRCVCLELS